MKYLLVLAGPNGSGKSTVIRNLYNTPNFPKIYMS